MAFGTGQLVLSMTVFVIPLTFTDACPSQRTLCIWIRKVTVPFGAVGRYNDCVILAENRPPYTSTGVTATSSVTVAEEWGVPPGSVTVTVAVVGAVSVAGAV
jgi:hypothetical protein